MARSLVPRINETCTR
ncbi:hypothetical protein AYX14_07046 [Cryptococcus neoformans]|nr:hypothetical protein AYX14_07046 [Cryptococcus neoformans var. grubii]